MTCTECNGEGLLTQTEVCSTCNGMGYTGEKVDGVEEVTEEVTEDTTEAIEAPVEAPAEEVEPVEEVEA